MYDASHFWSDPEHTFGARHPQRAEAVGRLIASLHASTVLDLGCGNQALRYAIEARGCKYIPCDLVKRSEDCIACDLNRGQYPQFDVDLTVAVGLIQYIEDIDWLFAQIASHSGRCIITHSPYADLASVFGTRVREECYPIRTSISYGSFLCKFYKYFVLCDELVLPTGCRLFCGYSRHSRLTFSESQSLSTRQQDSSTLTSKDAWTRFKQDNHDQFIEHVIHRISPSFVLKVCSGKQLGRQRHPLNSVVSSRSIDFNVEPRLLEDELNQAAHALLLLPMKMAALTWLEAHQSFAVKYFRFILVQYPLFNEMCSLGLSCSSPEAQSQNKAFNLLASKRLLFANGYCIQFETMTELFAQVLLGERQE
jgi:hypothetical protein